MKQLISIVTPVYNESANVEELHRRIATVMSEFDYEYEHICIDNRSTDDTVAKLKAIAKNDAHVKIIVNTRNFGYIRSSYHGLMQARGHAVVLIASDLQDPPEMIKEFIEQWRAGFKAVFAVKPESEESFAMATVRRFYYGLSTRIAEAPLVKNATGAGLFDRAVIDALRSIEDPYPYFRGLVCEIGHPIALVKFKQPRRKRGISTQNFYSLYDMAMLGITKHSRVPLRIMTILGFSLSVLSFFIAIGYLTAKLISWNSFELGLAPLLIGVFLFGSMQMFFLGLLGEYVSSIHTHVRKLPHVVEAERVNF